MEKIKSRWRKNYLEGDEAKDGYISGNNKSSNGDRNNINNLNHHNHHHHHHHNSFENSEDGISSSNTHNDNESNINNSNNQHHRKHDHHNHNHHHHSSSKNSTPPTYEPINENLYLDEKRNGRSRKDARSMVCDCILTKEERARGVMGCLDDCLNRMLMIECGPKCTLGDHCLNKRFQKCQSAKVETFKTKKKGWGLRTSTELPAGSFIMEYVGEVVRSKELRSRVKKYTRQKIKHHYFMALRSDEIIDATCKGNLTRFINHSCEPNCETQKWTVNGELRIGFFTIKNLQAGEEITFDYQFQRYGKKAQKCYCDTPSCRGYIGGNEQTFSLDSHSSPINENKAHKKSYKHGLLVDVALGEQINALAEAAADGLKTRDQVIALASLSIKAEEVDERRKLLDIIKATKSSNSLKLFLDYHGLEIICLWMRDPHAGDDFKTTIIEILERLPITSKTKVVESNVYRMVERWATEEPILQSAVRLLKKFQDLSPGFKIPRLIRIQRIEIEKKMDEERSEETDGDKSSHPFARLNHSKPTNGLVNNTTATKRKFDSLSTNNIDLTPAPKISKEEHRQQFEMNVRLKDYYDNLEKHYGPAVVELIKLSHRAFPSINGLPMPYPQIPPVPPVAPVSQVPNPGLLYLAPTAIQPPAPTTSVDIKPEATTSSQNTRTRPSDSTLIVLANHSIESSHTIDDELAFSKCDYDEYYTDRDRPLTSEDIINKTYPYPGSYYTTPDGETWFATVAMGRRTQKPQTVIVKLGPKSPIKTAPERALAKEKLKLLKPPPPSTPEIRRPRA